MRDHAKIGGAWEANSASHSFFYTSHDSTGRAPDSTVGRKVFLADSVPVPETRFPKKQDRVLTPRERDRRTIGRPSQPSRKVLSVEWNPIRLPPEILTSF